MRNGITSIPYVSHRTPWILSGTPLVSLQFEDIGLFYNLPHSSLHFLSLPSADPHTPFPLYFRTEVYSLCLLFLTLKLDKSINCVDTILN